MKIWALTAIFVFAFAESNSLEEVMLRSRVERDHTTLCGPMSLARLMSLSGREVPFESLLRRFERRTDEGVQLGEILLVSESFDFSVEARKYAATEIRKVPVPSILLVDSNVHCLVFEAVDEDFVMVWDPSSMRSLRLPTQVLINKWDGVAIAPAVGDSKALSVTAGMFFVVLGVYFFLKRPL